MRSLLPLLLQLERPGGASGARPVRVLDRAERAQAWIALVPLSDQVQQVQVQQPLVERFYAPVVPFSTLRDEIALDELAARWRGEETGELVVPRTELEKLKVLLGGNPAPTVRIVSLDAVRATLEENPGAVGIVPFESITPRFKVLAVDGRNVLSNELNAADYPLAVAVVTQGEGARELHRALDRLGGRRTNRDPSKLTTLVMTGVTAMSRMTALRLDQNGFDYPARVISSTLRAADITHISNEVPFLDDCRTDPSANNLILCSHTNYWAALEAVGTDIVGLSGNHVNDFGRDGARRSIAWYRENNIPIYGSGLNEEEACAPLYLTHNGNTFAFIAALAFDPAFAWASEEEPGACYYFSNKERILQMIADIGNQVDVVAVELQHTETYAPYPIASQIADFRELKEAGVDIVTGVQSHVPQAVEPYDDGIIVYGLGNFFFDQMWSWQTRTELMARHTIYDGVLLNTEILTAVLEDYAQPRWTTETERETLLRSIFAAAPPRP